MVSGPRILRAFLGLVSVLLTVSAGPPQTFTASHTCEGDCASQLPACQSAWLPFISAVFLGRATEIREEDVPITLDGKKALTGREFVTFEVEEAFIGVTDRVVTVTTGGDLCGFPFSKGKRYLVYGRRLASGALYVSLCSSTKWAERAADDLKYLRALPSAPHGATIYGAAYRYKYPEDPRAREMSVRPGYPDTGQKIEVRGAGQNYEAVVDNHGNFSLSGLPPGPYTVLLNTNGQVQIHKSSGAASTTVDVADKGCARFEFWVDPFVHKESATPHDGRNSPTTQPTKEQGQH